MILITGGRGSVGSNLLTLLRADDLPIRVGSRHPEKLQLPSEVTAVPCDLTDPTTFPAALAGVTAVFLYAEPTTIDEFCTAAAEAGVEHIVLLSSISVLGADPQRNPIGKLHLDTEIGLAKSSITSTVLRPGTFAGNARSWTQAIKYGQPISLPYPNSYTEPIHEFDIAAAAHALLTEPEHRATEHTLTGPEALTFSEQIDRIAEVIGRPIAVDQVTPEAWKQQMAPHLPAHIADGLLDHWRRHDGVPVPITDAVATLTGRPARTFTSWVEEHSTEFGA